ncbi:MAG: hypothetical protein AAF389_11090 [Gemmatimonadota bacterium]
MSRGVRSALLSALAVAAVAAAIAVERGSLERANRLHRGGQWDEAGALYRDRTQRTDDARLRYNLGTALATAREEGADAELARAAATGSGDIQSRATYNRGYLSLDRAMGTHLADSVRIHATASAEANRTALRLQPSNDDAKWNLAMALRLLDSIDAVERRSGREMQEGAVEADVVTRSVNVPDAAEDEFAEDPPAEGEEEAAAVVGDETPLSLEQAAELLGRTHMDATELLGKLLALESRSQFGRRPSRGARRW